MPLFKYNKKAHSFESVSDYDSDYDNDYGGDFDFFDDGYGGDRVDEYSVDTRQESLSLCHGTVQPVGNIIELEARDNPNGEPLKPLYETPGIWASDQFGVCETYTNQSSGMVIGDEGRFGIGSEREAQVYHFDLPDVTVSTVFTKGKEREHAEELVREAMDEEPDVLRLERSIGTEYLILNPDKARLVKITDADGNELPPEGGMKLRQPSADYCKNQSTMLGERIYLTERMLATLEQLKGFQDTWDRRIVIDEGEENQDWRDWDPERLLDRDFILETQQANDEFHNVAREALSAIEQRASLYRWRQKDGVDLLVVQSLDYDLENLVEDLDEDSTSQNEYERSLEYTGDMSRTLRGLIEQQLSADWKVHEPSDYPAKDWEKLLDEARVEREYWRERCETKRRIPNSEYCLMQRESAEREYRNARRNASELADADPSAIMLYEEQLQGAKQRESVATRRLRYWKTQCSRLEKVADESLDFRPGKGMAKAAKETSPSKGRGRRTATKAKKGKPTRVNITMG